jgi:hypothetical protein
MLRPYASGYVLHYTLVLKRCAADAAGYAALMSLRNKTHGRSRTFLSDKPDGMDFPIKVCDGLYAGGDFDTGALIRMLTTGILVSAGYDTAAVVLEDDGQRVNYKLDIEKARKAA